MQNCQGVAGGRVLRVLLRVWLGGRLDGSLEAVNPCKSLQEQLRGSQLDAKQQQLEEEEDLRVTGEEEGLRSDGLQLPKGKRHRASTGWARLEVALLAGGGSCRTQPETRRGGLARAKCAPLALREGGPGEVMLGGVGERNSQRGGVLCK